MEIINRIKDSRPIRMSVGQLREEKLQAKKEVAEYIEKELFKLGNSLTKIQINDVIDIIYTLQYEKQWKG